MKKRKLLASLIALTLIIVLAFTACGPKQGGGEKETTKAEAKTEAQTEEKTTEAAKAGTLEAWWNADDQAASELLSSFGEVGIQIEIKDNSLIYIYELSHMVGDEDLEALKTYTADDFKQAFDGAVESEKQTFVDIAKTLETEAGIKGVQVVLKYTLEGKEVYTTTITAEG